MKYGKPNNYLIEKKEHKKTGTKTDQAWLTEGS